MTRDPRLILLFALVAALAVYAPTLGRGLVDYDDGYMIRDNWVVKTPSLASAKTILFDLDSPKRFVLSPEYLPVRDFSIMLDAALWGDWYPGFHITNVVLYLLAIALWFSVLVGFGIDRTVAAVALLLWALHPAHAESVAWLAERKGLLGVMFAGLAGFAYVRLRAQQSWRWFALALVATLFAVWSKAQAAFGVAALGGLELALPSPQRRQAWRSLGAMAVVGALAFVPVMVLAARADVVGLTSHAPGGRVSMVLGVHGFYLELATMLVRNAVSYPVGTQGPSMFQVILGAAFLLAACVAVWRVPWLRAPVAIWLIAWFPVSHLALPLQMIFVADRYLLVSSLGFCLGVSLLVARMSSSRLRWVLVGALTLAAFLRTLDAQSTWRDPQTLWERAVASNPDDGEAWSAYAEAVARTGNSDAALRIADEGLTHVRHPRLLLRRALLLLDRDPAAGATAMREAAVAGDARAMSNLALLLLARNQLDEALRWARDGAARGPMYAPARRALGRVELTAAHLTEAEVEFRRAYALEPSCTNGYNLALVLQKRGHSAEARAQLVPCVTDPALGPRVRTLLQGLR